MNRNVYFIDTDLVDIIIDEKVKISGIGYINPSQYALRETTDAHAEMNRMYLTHRLSQDISRFDNTLVIIDDYDIDFITQCIDNDVMLKIDEFVNISYRFIYKVIVDDGVISFRYANLSANEDI